MSNELANDPLMIATEGKEIIRITSDGRVFWNQREVETDADFRSAMLELVEYLSGRKK